MLIWAGLCLLACAVALAGRWLLRPRDGLGRPKPFPAVSVLLLVALAVGCLVPVYRHHRLETRLEAAASALVGVPVTVNCQTAGQQFVDAGAELGFVRYGPDGVPERATLIKRDQCSDLADYLGSDKSSPSRDQVVAVHILSHEARHMAGVTVEAEAECGAMQRDARAAQLLGASARAGTPAGPDVLDELSTRRCPTLTAPRTAGRPGRSTRGCLTRPGRRHDSVARNGTCHGAAPVGREGESRTRRSRGGSHVDGGT